MKNIWFSFADYFWEKKFSYGHCEIAEIITGVATFTVAVVLLCNLRKQNQQLDIQNKDNKREDAFRGVEIHLNRMSSIYTNKILIKYF